MNEKTVEDVINEEFKRLGIKKTYRKWLENDQKGWQAVRQDLVPQMERIGVL